MSRLGSVWRREHLVQTLRGHQAYPVPCATLYIGLYTAHIFPLKLAEAYAELAGGESELTLGAEQELDARVEAWVRTYESFDPPFAWMPVRDWMAVAALDGVRVRFSEDNCLRVAPDDSRQDLLAPLDTAATWPWERESPPSLDSLEELVPLVDAETLIADGCHEMARRLVARCDAQVWLRGAIGSPYDSLPGVLGFAVMMAAMRRDPVLIEAVIERTLHNCLERAKLIKASGVRGIFIEECCASSDLISEADYCRFAVPSDYQLVAELKAMGFDVLFHMTGGIEGRLPHLRELAADGIALEDGKKGFEVDVGRVRKELGAEITLWGNINPVIIRDGPRERIAAEVQEQFEQAGRPFVVSCGSPLTLDTPIENVNMMLQAAAALTEQGAYQQMQSSPNEGE